MQSAVPSDSKEKFRAVHKEEKTAYRKWIGSQYFERPDGQDLPGKLFASIRTGSIIGLCAGYIYSRWRPVPTDHIGRAIRLAQVFFPTVGMAVTFTCVTYTATIIRQKDDQLNYVLGATAGAMVCGVGMGNPKFGIKLAVPLSLIGIMKKTAELRDEEIFPTIKQTEFSSYIKNHWDTSLLPDSRRGNWTKEPLSK